MNQLGVSLGLAVVVLAFAYCLRDPSVSVFAACAGTSVVWLTLLDHALTACRSDSESTCQVRKQTVDNKTSRRADQSNIERGYDYAD